MLLMKSREHYHVELVGPTRQDNLWQAKATDGFAASNFKILCQPVRSLSGRQNQPELETHVERVQQTDHQDPVVTKRLWSLRSARAASARADSRLRRRIYPAIGHRRHPIRGRACALGAPHTLHRAGQDALGPPDDGRSDRCCSFAALVSRRTEGVPASHTPRAAIRSPRLNRPKRIRHQRSLRLMRTNKQAFTYQIRCCRPANPGAKTVLVGL